MISSFHSIAFSPFPVWANAWMFRDYAEKIAYLGFSGIEVTADRPHAFPDDLDAVRRRDIRSMMEDLNLKITAVCPLVSPGRNPASFIPEELADARKYLRQCAELAADLKSPYVVYPAGWVVRGNAYSEAWKISRETLRLTAEEGARLGIEVLIEAVRKRSSNLLWNSRQAAMMKEEADHPSVRLMMDTFHVWSENEDVAEVVERFGNDLRHVHFVDISENGDERRVPGQGVHDMGKVVSLLGKRGFEGALSVEIWGNDPEKMARESSSFFHKTFGSIHTKKP